MPGSIFAGGMRAGTDRAQCHSTARDRLGQDIVKGGLTLYAVHKPSPRLRWGGSGGGQCRSALDWKTARALLSRPQPDPSQPRAGGTGQPFQRSA
ncbi:hypothetical protein BOS5A_200665 [Bosea sp. EC-HK365B]|nr:hypothetical protein BOSE21B_110615 [Bosea sp. 21B]CAD5278584.1 hypothetical protein BOSE7B_40601 [Bosea sp. 7B]VVT58597.1 hypothetical protein BOS5A_200665 [Bosea sp. EC-HK365B]VXC81366.1 hypothetical protein BOSE127_50308 [Bosea sp. 127]